MTTDRRGLVAAACLAAFALHNLEEGLAYARMHDAVSARIAAAGLVWWRPTPAQFDLALLTRTLTVALALGWAARGGVTRARLAVLQALPLVMLANVVVPHVPAALLMGGYVPGLLTALAVNIPVSLWALRVLRSQKIP